MLNLLITDQGETFNNWAGLAEYQSLGSGTASWRESPGWLADDGGNIPKGRAVESGVFCLCRKWMTKMMTKGFR